MSVRDSSAPTLAAAALLTRHSSPPRTNTHIQSEKGGQGLTLSGPRRVQTHLSDGEVQEREDECLKGTRFFISIRNFVVCSHIFCIYVVLPSLRSTNQTGRRQYYNCPSLSPDVTGGAACMR